MGSCFPSFTSLEFRIVFLCWVLILALVLRTVQISISISSIIRGLQSKPEESSSIPNGSDNGDSTTAAAPDELWTLVVDSILIFLTEIVPYLVILYFKFVVVNQKANDNHTFSTLE